MLLSAAGLLSVIVLFLRKANPAGDGTEFHSGRTTAAVLLSSGVIVSAIGWGLLARSTTTRRRIVAVLAIMFAPLRQSAAWPLPIRVTRRAATRQADVALSCSCATCDQIDGSGRARRRWGVPERAAQNTQHAAVTRVAEVPIGRDRERHGAGVAGNPATEARVPGSRDTTGDVCRAASIAEWTSMAPRLPARRVSRAEGFTISEPRDRCTSTRRSR
jgi:hypothetical protein